MELAQVPYGNGGGPFPSNDKTPLAYLLDIAVQKTYHDLFTTAELLARKPELDRKIDLVTFASRTRQLFIRILAVVKWARSANKVHICENIGNFLEYRARLIRETSDTLAQLAREKLIGARLPSYPITDAVDALTVGTVNFLPERISEATTPFTPATEQERQEILPRLGKILAARLAITDLPLQFTNVSIKNGRVTLAVDGEFQVKLGITSDNLFTPWQLYKIKIFLRDPEEPEQDLVHPLQIQTLTNFVQGWLFESENPLVELYRYLHCFCQSLRLQILTEQAFRIRDRSASKQKHVHIPEYIPCKSLTIEYWKDYVNSNNIQKKTVQQPQQQQSTAQARGDIRMTIICDDDAKFRISHFPPLLIEDSLAIIQILDRPMFTMEEILNRTIYARSQRRFEELKEIILSTTSAIIVIDPMIPALKCELLPESTSEEVLFISISPLNGIYKVISYMESYYSQQIENSLNRDQTNLSEAINLFKIWLIQQRIAPLIAHLSCRVYTRLPSLNPKHELTSQFTNKAVYIELTHHEGYYILVYVSDVKQLLVQYYLLVVEKRSSAYDPVTAQQQQQMIIQQNLPGSVDEPTKWILEPVLLSPLDPSTFIQKDDLSMKNFRYDKQKETIEDENTVKNASVISLKLLLKLVNYYDEMLTFTFLKDELFRKKIICKGIIYSPWTGIPYLDIVRLSSGEESLMNEELASYISECFWPRLQACTIRLTYTLRDVISSGKHNIERYWNVHLKMNENYFQNLNIKTPYNTIVMCSHLPSKAYSRIVDHIRNELRSMFELTHLFESYAISLQDCTDLRAISEISYFNFFKCIINYGPNFSFGVCVSYNNALILNVQENNSLGGFDLRFINNANTLLPNTHYVLNTKLSPYLNRRHSLKKLVRVLHMTAVPLASICRLDSFNRPIVIASHGGTAQPILSIVPYTDTRWRLYFWNYFVLDIQICGPNLILVRDGYYSVQLNSALPDFNPIPHLKEFLARYMDDTGLTYEFDQITERYRDRDFLTDMNIHSASSTIHKPLPPPSLPPPSTQQSYGTMTSLLHTPSGPASVQATSSMNPLTPVNVNQQQQLQPSSPSTSLIAPSPSFQTMGTPSPMMTGIGSPAQLTAPSPMGSGMNIATPSPANLYGEMPFSISSPASQRQHGSTFPGSFISPSPGTPSMNIPSVSSATTTTVNTNVSTFAQARGDMIDSSKPPSITSTLINNYNRHLSQPIFPLYLSQQTFFKMLHTSDSRQWSKLEFFLASSTIVRQFARAVAEPVDQNNITIRAVNNEPDTYRMEHLALQLQFIFDKISGLYRIKFTTTEQAPIASQQQQCLWLYDELQTLDTFFNEIFFTIYPLPMAIDIISLHSTANRGTVVATLQKLFTFIQSKILKDLIKIMRLEQNPDPQHMWRARWCLTVPSGNGFAQVGNPSIGCGPNRHVYIFVFQFIPRTEMQLPNATTFIVPLQYDLQTNLTNLWDTSKATSMYVERKLVDVSRLVEGVKQTLSTKTECSLYPTILELVSHFQLSQPTIGGFPS